MILETFSSINYYFVEPEINAQSAQILNLVLTQSLLMANTSRALALPDLEHLKVCVLGEDEVFGPQQVLEWKGNLGKAWGSRIC